jgi:hypothetical protein
MLPLVGNGEAKVPKQLQTALKDFGVFPLVTRCIFFAANDSMQLVERLMLLFEEWQDERRTKHRIIIPIRCYSLVSCAAADLIQRAAKTESNLFGGIHNLDISTLEE